MLLPSLIILITGRPSTSVNNVNCLTTEEASVIDTRGTFYVCGRYSIALHSLRSLQPRFRVPDRRVRAREYRGIDRP